MGCPYGYGSVSAVLSDKGAEVEALQIAKGDSEKRKRSRSDTNFEESLGDLSQRSGAQLRRGRKDPLYYSDYLKLDKILDAQEPVSWKAKDFCHDELLFVTIHQTYELWFKQILFEIDSVRDIFECLRLGEKQISTALHRLQRVKEIQKILVEQIRVLETMSPQEFLNFRDYLFPASGFQSLQFRLIEIKLGLRLEQRVNQEFMSKLNEKDRKRVEEAMSEPSLCDYVERWLRNMPFVEFRGYSFPDCYKAAIQKMLNLDKSAINRMLDGEDREKALKEIEQTNGIYESVWDRDVHKKRKEDGLRRLGFIATSACLMIMLYEDQPMFHVPAQLLKTLVDLDDNLNQWRHRHTQMVHRMIGQKIGTGGSLGHRYLKETVDRHRIFSDFANMSTLLLPRRFLPELPTVLKDQMKYFYSIEPYDRTLFELGGGGDNVELDWSFC